MIEYHRYTLRSRDDGSLNMRSQRREFDGALIRVDGTGVGCIHPWPELGDASLDEELSALARGEPLVLASCALECASIDSEARREGRWLFEDLAVGASHWTVRPHDDPEVVVNDGFDTVKLKLGADIEAAVSRVERWAGVEDIKKLRLDFNESLTAKSFVDFWQRLPVVSQAKIEFVEDPVSYDFHHWMEIEAKTGVALALDRQVAEFGDEWTGVVVAKPATVAQWKISVLAATKLPRLIFTSYMDHAIGQCWAAYVAATHHGMEGDNGLMGLLTHECFEADEFFAALRREGNVLLPPPGTGLGFDDQLEALLWKPLN